jgi:hypothetical protein
MLGFQIKSLNRHHYLGQICPIDYSKVTMIHQVHEPKDAGDGNIIELQLISLILKNRPLGLSLVKPRNDFDGENKLQETDTEKYFGQVSLRGLRHGFGVVLDKGSGDLYIGEFRDGYKDGFGCIIFGESTRHSFFPNHRPQLYIGGFSRGIIHTYPVGLLRFSQPAGSYRGEIQRGRVDGKGLLIHYNEQLAALEKIDGYFVDGVAEGRARVSCFNQNKPTWVFKGELRQNII